MFNMTSEELQKNSAINTTSEIYQQPVVWKELVSSLFDQKEELTNFIESIYKKHEHVRVILSGAGTSAFIGDILVPLLRKENNANVQFDSVPTTNIVSNPEEYLQKDIPTIMVSFARSGNSPESVAAVALGEQIVDHFYQVVITCNQDGQLAKDTKNDKNSVTILMPDDAHDKGLAMTSSFTCMLITAYTLFTSNDLDKNILGHAEKLIESLPEKINDILKMDFERIIYLGSGILGQLTHEAALKMLELTAGKVVAVHESSLGFRHGPKSILNAKSLVVIFLSNNPYTRKYDVDMLRELSGDISGAKVVAITDKNDSEIAELADWVISINNDANDLINDFHVALPAIIVAQVLALKKSLQLGITPDNPSPDGQINRVVQGVTIYDYMGED
ncbi:SIS domain-containing protein [Virgibacillus sp. NKC19-3]|uniref:SIS domain-containing protein n=1 Tax=Virgibacillus saliphilus TaxID=2831674 RepID=UPI001C9B33CD|nr:SIS domain-containing protein [Virgibacillus sp. NKC19-3]MBY7144560.1 SIS domain-containing protein [Virgibacillus sp. NKC19-3]